MIIIAYLSLYALYGSDGFFLNSDLSEVQIAFYFRLTMFQGWSLSYGKSDNILFGKYLYIFNVNKKIKYYNISGYQSKQCSLRMNK